jgi:hypothetical protein
MKFSKEFLIDKLDTRGGYVAEGISGTSRWSIDHWGVFEHESKFYETVYSVGATECQDGRPYEYDDAEIECPEVVAVIKQVTVYEPIK